MLFYNAGSLNVFPPRLSYSHDIIIGPQIFKYANVKLTVGYCQVCEDLNLFLFNILSD